jgi:hypothetical protein
MVMFGLLVAIAPLLISKGLERIFAIKISAFPVETKVVNPNFVVS